MKKVFVAAAFVICLFVNVPCFATPVLSVPLPGGYFDAEYFAGSGSNTAYFVVDFGGNGGTSHGFGYRWDGTQTADNALLAIDAAGALDMTYGNFGTPAAPNLFIQRLTDPPNTDLPDFNVDGRFWDYFLAPTPPRMSHGPNQRWASAAAISPAATSFKHWPTAAFTAFTLRRIPHPHGCR